MKQSVIGLFGRVMNNNVELCSDWLFHSAAIHHQAPMTCAYGFSHFIHFKTEVEITF